MESFLEIERACSRLIISLADLTDRGEYASALKLFADNAVMDRDGERFVGIGDLERAFAARPKNRITCHLLSNILVEPLTDNTASSRCWVTVYRYVSNEAEKPLPPHPLRSPEVIATYQDNFIRSEGGWLLSKRITRTVFQTPNLSGPQHR